MIELFCLKSKSSIEEVNRFKIDSFTIGNRADIEYLAKQSRVTQIKFEINSIAEHSSGAAKKPRKERPIGCVNFKLSELHFVRDANQNLESVCVDVGKLTSNRSQFVFEPSLFSHLKLSLKINQITHHLVVSLADAQKSSTLEFNKVGSRKNTISFSFDTSSKDTQKSRASLGELSKVVYEFHVPSWKKNPPCTKKFEDHITNGGQFVCPFCCFRISASHSLSEMETVIRRHLSLSHFRLHFHVAQLDRSTLKCSVHLNEKFDCTFFWYSNKSAYLGYSECRLKPTRQNYYQLPNDTGSSSTLFLFFNSRLLKRARLESAEIEDDIELLIAKNANKIPERLYYSARTNAVKLKGDAGDESSDDDCSWLREQTELYLNEFMDVNKGEKSFMLLWNEHCSKYDLMSDRRFIQLCTVFIDEQLEAVVGQCLVNNFLVHLANVTAYGLLKTSGLIQMIDYFNLKRKQLQ
jgi:hypothetical protein